MARKPSNPLIDDQIMDQAFSELAALVEESEALLAQGSVGPRGRAVRRQLAAALDRATGLTRQLAEQARPALRDTEHYVRTRPLQALGLAAAAGMVLAFAFNRRS